MVLVVAGCGLSGTSLSASSTPNRSAETIPARSRLIVATTAAPLTSIVSAMGGDLIFINGLALEDPTKELAVSNRKTNAEIIRLGNRVLPEDRWIFDISFPREGGKPNPHLWTNPPMVKQDADVVRNELSLRDLAHATSYHENTVRFAAAVDALDTAMRTSFATLTIDRRKLVTSHDADAYFALEYGWTVIGAIQPSDFDEPSPKDVAELIDQVRTEQVPAISGSEVLPSPVLEQIAREAGVRYVDTLRDDDLPGSPGDADHSLLALLRLDYVTIVHALGGDASALRALDLTPSVPDPATYPSERAGGGGSRWCVGALSRCRR